MTRDSGRIGIWLWAVGLVLLTPLWLWVQAPKPGGILKVVWKGSSH